jgi:hypothetical protein
MGDYILMKKLLLLLILLTGSLFASASTDWVDKQVQAIKPPRVGVSHAAINSVKNPFIFVYKESSASTTVSSTSSAQTSKVTPMQLSAIVNNSALISGTWYQVNDKVRGYTLAKIESDSVLLTLDKTRKMLFVTNENPNIKIQVK